MRRKIPNKLYKHIKEHRNLNYKININPLIPLSHQSILQGTNDMLSVLYRTYWVSEEDRKKLESLDIIELNKQEELLRKKYNPDNIFKNNKENKTINETSLIDIQNLTWYKRAFFKIRNFIINFRK